MSTTRSVDGSEVPPIEIRQLPGLLHGRDDIHGHVERLLDPFALILSLCICAVLFDRDAGSPYLILCLGVVMLTFPGRSRLHVPVFKLIRDVVISAETLLFLLIAFGWATGYINAFSREALLHWLWVAPLCLIGTHLAFRASAPLVLKRAERCVIVGMNDQGIALATRIQHNP